jgi:hypothetical protein
MLRNHWVALLDKQTILTNCIMIELLKFVARVQVREAEHQNKYSRV